MLLFNNIKNSPEALLQFFEQMPKGGDIHHHALGALWAEDILEFAIANDFWIDIETGTLHKMPLPNSYLAKEIKPKGLWEDCLRAWSIWNYDHKKQQSHTHFFDIFPKIAAVFIGYEAYWIEKIVQRAKNEGILYIETLIECPSESQRVWNWALEYEQNMDAEADEYNFEEFYTFLKDKGLSNALTNVVAQVNDWKKASLLVPEVLLRFQLYALRMLDPRQVLAQLILCFEAAAASADIVGVNLVAPEYHANALTFYRMQMRACRWLQKQFPEVNIALHAGELSSDLVAPEHLSFHIAEAVAIAGAKRVGHGVDLCTENDFELILARMRKEEIAIEILPTSNDFILRIADAAHPFELYFRAGLPIIVASDDPGLLRCTLASEYFRLARSYPFLKYEDFKQFSFNSIKHSFLGSAQKVALIKILEGKFDLFENSLAKS